MKVDIFQEYEKDGDAGKVIVEMQPLVTSTKLAKMVAKQLAQFLTTKSSDSWESLASILLECEKQSALSADAMATVSCWIFRMIAYG